MADNKDTDDLFNEIGELGELGEGDFQDFLGDDDSELANFSTEFDGLMDLADFEELGSSDSMEGLDDLLNMDSDNWASNLGEQDSILEDNTIDSIKSNISEQMPTKDIAMGSSNKSVNKEQKKASLKEIPDGDMGEEFLDLEADFAQGEDDIGNILTMGGADLDEDPDLAGIESINDELLLDTEFNEKQEKKALNSGKGKAAETSNSGKVSFFQKLFGNVPDENAAKNAAKEAERQAAKEAKKASKKTKEELALEKQEKQKAKEEAAAVKKAEQEAKKAKKDEEKKLKLAEKAAEKEAREQEEAKEPVTRINRVGAGIIFATFAMIAIVIIVGNNSYAYSQCIARAAAFFGQKEYTNAYNQIYGVKVKRSDEELKDQVMTVMFVEKQLNSFDNYFALEMYPEALDSLLKGLNKYDKYLEQARSLGIESDVNYVRDKIISELKSAFNISERSAYHLLSISDPREYTKQVIKAANT